MAARQRSQSRRRMSDDQLFGEALEHRSLKRQADELYKKAKDVQKSVLAELRVRGTTVETTKGKVVAGYAARGLKIMRLAQTNTDYLVEVAKDRLKPAVFRKLVSLTITKEAVDAALAAGTITAEDVEAIKVVTEIGEYIRTFGVLAEP